MYDLKDEKYNTKQYNSKQYKTVTLRKIPS